MADQNAAAHNAPDHTPLTRYDQAFALMVASMNFWTPNMEDRAMVRELAREILPKVNAKHPYLKPMVTLARQLLDPHTPRADWGRLNTALSGAAHDFLRWRGLMAYASAQEAEAAQAKGAAA